jgi:hypothetical protein
MDLLGIILDGEQAGYSAHWRFCCPADEMPAEGLRIARYSFRRMAALAMEKKRSRIITGKNLGA